MKKLMHFTTGLRSLHSRIVIFFTLLLVAVQLIAFIIINSTSQEIAYKQNIQALKTADMVFRQLSAQNRQRLIDTANLLSSDFGFRKAVATNDSGTVLSVLNNHGARIKADRMLLVSLDNVVLADTLSPAEFPKQSPLANLIQSAEKTTNGASGLLLIDQKAYQIVLVPVLAPDPIAWVAMGFLIDDKLVHQLHDVTGLQVTFLYQTNQGLTLLASTQPSEAAQNILKAANNSVSFDQPITIDDHISLFTIQQKERDLTFITVLQRSWQESIESLNQLRMMLFELALISLILSLFGSFFLARKITHPLKILAYVVNNLRNGDYSEVAKLSYDERFEKVPLSSSTKEVDILRQAYVEILRLAHEDVLTGLPNRVLFNDRLKQMVKLAKRTNGSFFVLMLDLDRFKFINDTMGHHAGDEVIKIIGSRLKSLLRESDTVARLGGDEFALILTNVQLANVKILVKKLQKCIEVPMDLEGNLVDVSCSIGIAVFPEHGDDDATLLRHADAAMYSAKSEKIGSAIYDPNKNTPQKKQLNLLGELRNAIENNEFELHYQPQIDLLHSRVVAVEALIRWRHPIRGMVPPLEFIEFAESSGLIRDITQWVVNKAILQCKQWLDEGLLIKVSVNISARDLVDPEFPVLVEQKLAEYQLPASMLCLEITESTLMKDPRLSLEILKRLNDLGVSIAIDDFGTGYSSLAYIAKLPAKELKIDRFFVKDMIANPKYDAIVRSTITLAHNLGIQVVAEGIESEEESALLLAYGCDCVQGYLFSKPLPNDQFLQWINTAKRANTAQSDSSVGTEKLQFNLPEISL
jgi:diguanylate cyclase (GGDEF)-like protein